MLTSEVMIERPPAVVWAFFTNPDNWNKWSRLSLSTAKWEVGGSLFFEKGMHSKIDEVARGSMVKFGDSWSEETWTFSLSPSGGTFVRVDENPRGMAYTDHGTAALAKTRKALDKLKAAIEAPVEPESEDESEAESEDEAEIEDEPEDEIPNPRLRRIPW